MATDEAKSLRIETPGIGSALRRSRAAMAVGGATAVGVVGLDMVLASRGLATFWSRLGLSCGAALIYGWLAGWEWESLGFRLRPAQGWRYWVKLTAKLGGVALLLLGGGIAVQMSGQWPESEAERMAGYVFSGPSEFWRWTWRACVPTPMAEEGIYRLALCVPFAALIGRGGTVAVSGCVFAALHFVYGTPGLDNCIAGFILGWAFLKSGSLIVPVMWHSLGNLLVGLYRLALYYLSV